MKFVTPSQAEGGWNLSILGHGGQVILSALMNFPPLKCLFFGYFETTILEGTRFLTPLRGGAELFSPYVREALIFYLMVGGS